MSMIRNDRPHIQRNPRVRDRKFLHWLHMIPCIACEQDGTPSETPIEAAHQKFTEGLGGKLGVRPSDSETCPLCAYHHRLAPDACDVAQQVFWLRRGIDAGDYCSALYAAFKAGKDGMDVFWGFVATTRK